MLHSMSNKQQMQIPNSLSCHQFLEEQLLNLSEWQLESEAAEQADEQTDPDLSHEHLAEEPHGEVHVVVLHSEVVPVEGHEGQVGHEGDLGDGGPEAPGEEVVDRSPVA